MTKRGDDKIDSDRDGLSDKEEKIFGTDPADPDTDKDGMPDGQEVKMGRNPAGPGYLRDLFIPHSGNNYHPHALHPKRLLFYTISITAVKALSVAILLLLPIGAWLTPDVLRQQSLKIIELTNAVRRNVGLSQLRENNSLDNAGLAKAQDMLLNQYFAHLNSQKQNMRYWLSQVGYDFAAAGENLAMGFADAESVVNGWSKSPTHYANLVDKNYSEIGVGAVSGPYQGFETTLVAQYFGLPAALPAEPKSQPAAKVQPKPKAAAIDLNPARDVLSSALPEKPASQNLSEPAGVASQNLEASQPQPLVDLARSKLIVTQIAGQKDRVVKAIVYLGSDAAQAEVVFSSYRVALSANPAEPGLWTGQAIVFSQDEEQIFNPVVLPSLFVWDKEGNKTAVDINWENIMPVKPSLTSQYFFLKTQKSGLVGKLLRVSSYYFKIMLFLASVVLLLNILIEIKKQHPRVILSTLGLISLLIAFIVV